MSNEINLFEYATRYDVRFQTVKGVITVGQLWDLPLRSAKQPGFDLDTVAVPIASTTRSRWTSSSTSSRLRSKRTLNVLTIRVVLPRRNASSLFSPTSKTTN